jgi:hypothetical protein
MSAEQQGELFAVVWERPENPFRLRADDLVRIENRVGRVLRVTESAAIVLVKQPKRQFKTRFDKPVEFQPPPITFRISANSEIEVIYRKPINARKRIARQRRAR